MDKEHDCNQPLYNFLALKGGGARGPIHLGVTMALNDLGILKDIDMIGGTSAGAIAALLIATGWTPQKIHEELDTLDLNKMVCQEWSFLAPFRLYWNLGMHSGDKLTEWFEKIVEAVTGNPQATFLDWHEKKMALDKVQSSQHMKHLYMEACNIETGFNEEFSHTSLHKDVPIALALSASMAYPGYFTPKEIKGNKYSDGGLQSDCPTSLFEYISGRFNPKLLPVWLDSLDRLRYIIYGEQPCTTKVNTISQVAYANAVALYNVQLRQLINSPHKDRFVFCDTLDVDTMDFGLIAQKQSELIDSGYYGVIRFFLLYHPELAKCTFNPHLLDQIVEMDYPISIREFNKGSILFDIKKSCIKLPILHTEEAKADEELESVGEKISPFYQEKRDLFMFSKFSDTHEVEMSSTAQEEIADTLPTSNRNRCRLM